MVTQMFTCMVVKLENGGIINMPIYEYNCEKCGNEFEESFPMDERAKPTKTPCEKDVGMDESVVCGGKVYLKMSLGSFHLKGGGWYKDGYGKKVSSGEKVAEKPKTESTGGVTKAKPIADN